MLAPLRWTVVQRMSALIIPIMLATWLVTPPTVIATSSLFALLALTTAFVWIAQTTYKSAQPAASLAQALHDADRTSSPAHQWRNR
jgi:uncharacterized membrane protein YoaK (UPF0700 family)